MRPALSARPQQTLLTSRQIHFINCALRDAALAPSTNDALDIVADALQRLGRPHAARPDNSAEVQHD